MHQRPVGNRSTRCVLSRFWIFKLCPSPDDQVFHLLAEAVNGVSVSLPNPKPIIPYVGLFTMITINPHEVAENEISTMYLPHLSIVRGDKFIRAPANATAATRNVARIFDPLALRGDSPKNLGIIPLSPQSEGFGEQRYWRLPVPAEAIFAALIERLHYDSSECEDIILANNIRDILNLQSHGEFLQDNAGDGSGHRRGGSPSGSRGDKRRGPSGREGGESSSKRKGPDSGGRASSRKAPKMGRQAAGGVKAAASDELISQSGE
jgi:hypothetical protein